MAGTPDADPLLRGASTHRGSGPPAVPGGRPPANARGVGLGLVGVVTICAVAPYNDWVVSNTYTVGNYLPVGLLLMLTALVQVVNAPLSQFTPRVALSFSEVGVDCAMALVSCTVAGRGLMRYLPSQLVAVSSCSPCR